MNAFALKATLLTKHAQHLVINPNKHGVKHGSNAWRTNSKLVASRVCIKAGAIRFCELFVIFSQQQGISHAVLQSGDTQAGVPAFLQTTV
jgi:hypothetical protein